MRKCFAKFRAGNIVCWTRCPEHIPKNEWQVFEVHHAAGDKCCGFHYYGIVQKDQYGLTTFSAGGVPEEELYHALESGDWHRESI